MLIMPSSWGWREGWQIQRTQESLEKTLLCSSVVQINLDQPVSFIISALSMHDTWARNVWTLYTLEVIRGDRALSGMA